MDTPIYDRLMEAYSKAKVNTAAIKRLTASLSADPEAPVTLHKAAIKRLTASLSEVTPTLTATKEHDLALIRTAEALQEEEATYPEATLSPRAEKDAARRDQESILQARRDARQKAREARELAELQRHMEREARAALAEAEAWIKGQNKNTEQAAWNKCEQCHREFATHRGLLIHRAACTPALNRKLHLVTY